MAFVSVPKDLTKVKNKIILNLTKRQLICLGIAAAVGFRSRCADWRSGFLFAQIQRKSEPCCTWHDGSDAAALLSCHVRERRTSFRESPEKYDYSEIYPSSSAEV